MKSERWSEVRALLEEALERAPGERSDFVEQSCSEDHELCEEVLRMLALEEGEASSERAQRLDSGATRKPPPVRPMPVPGDQLGSYRILHAIGAGGMSQVFEAEQDSPRRTVAIKILLPGSLNASALERFQTEAQLVARMRHPNIAQIYEAGSFGEDGTDQASLTTPFLAMELVPEACDLITYATRSGLDTNERLRLFLQACEAVHHAHQKGVIHRDLKPGNLIVDGQGTLKVIDFGVARLSEDTDAERVDLTRTGEVVGTLRYMSPEQLQPQLDLDTRSDVYALGVVLYQLISGGMPHEETGMGEMVVAILHQSPRAPSTLDAGLSRELDWIVLRCLEKEPELRYASASELALDLHRFLRDEPVLASAPSAIYQLQKFIRRHRLGVGAAALALLALIAALFIMSRLYLSTKEAQLAERLQAEETERQRLRAELQRDQALAVNELLSSSLRTLSDTSEGAIPELTDFLDSLRARVAETFSREPALEAQLRVLLADSYSPLGLPQEAIEERERAVELLRGLEGATAERALEQSLLLGHEMVERSRTEEGLALVESTLETIERAWPENTKLAFEGRAALARVLLSVGRAREAEQYAQSAQTLLTEEGGLVDATSRLDLLSLLANTRFWQGFAPQAIDEMRSCIQQRVELFGADEFAALSDRTHLANMLFQTRQYPEACALSREIWEIKNRLLGAEHISTVYSRSMLGAFLARSGQFVEAEEHLRAAAEAQGELLGSADPNTLRSLAGLSIVLQQTGRADEALELQVQLTEDLLQALGDRHPDYLIALSNLATQRWAAEQAERAVELLEQALQGWEELEEGGGPQSFKVLQLLAQWYYPLDRTEQALASIRRALEIGEGLYGTRDLQVALTRGQLGDYLKLVGRGEEARPILERANAELRELGGPDHPWTRHTDMLLLQLRSDD